MNRQERFYVQSEFKDANGTETELIGSEKTFEKAVCLIHDKIRDAGADTTEFYEENGVWKTILTKKGVWNRTFTIQKVTPTEI